MLCDHVTVSAPLAEVRRARAVRDHYDGVVGRVQQQCFAAEVRLPDGRTVSPDPGVASVPQRALTMAATAVYNGADDTVARHVANGLLVDNGYAWVALGVHDAQVYRRTVRALVATGDARDFVQLLAECYNEDF